MKNRPGWLLFLGKVSAFLGVFVLLHFAHHWLPYAWIRWLIGTSESVFEHAKMTFFAYAAANGLEFLIRRRLLPHAQRFWDARLATTAIAPWWMMAIWYLAPAIYGQAMPNDTVEVLYAILVLVVLAFLLGIFERQLEQLTFSRPARLAAAALCAIFLLEVLVFSYRLPWADVFAAPY